MMPCIEQSTATFAWPTSSSWNATPIPGLAAIPPARLAGVIPAVNDAVTTYGEALLEADRKRLNQTSAIGLDETSFVRLGRYKHTGFATTVDDVEHHQIIDILPTREYPDVAGWIAAQPEAWKDRICFGALDMSATYAAVYTVTLPKAPQVVDPFHAIALANRCLDDPQRRVQSEQTGDGAEKTIRSIGPAGSCSWARRISAPRAAHAWPRCSNWAIRTPRWPLPIESRSASGTSIAAAIPSKLANSSKSSTRTA
jgi:hypothetical protein